MALQSALSVMLALLLVLRSPLAAAASIDVVPAKLLPGSAPRQAVWPLPAAAQAASTGQAQSITGTAEHTEAGGALAAAAGVLPGIAAKAVARGHASLQHRPRHVRLPRPGTFMRVAAAEATAAAAVAPLVHAAAGAVQTRSEHSDPTGSSSSSSSATSVPNSRVLVAAGEQDNSSSNSATDCSTVTAQNGQPDSPSHSTLPPRDNSNGGTVQVTVSGTQGPSPNPQSATPGSSNSGSSSSSSSGSLPAQLRAGLQAGDVIVRGGNDGSWHCIRRPGCKPYALAFGAAFRPLMASGECQLMGGCEAVQQQGACNAPFSWEVDRRAAVVVQYCGEQCRCPGES
jgi:hypothetical protein